VAGINMYYNNTGEKACFGNKGSVRPGSSWDGCGWL
jgi:hypothetical protein